jgi:hypothetical protein
MTAMAPEGATSADRGQEIQDKDTWIEESLTIARELIRAGIPIRAANRAMRTTADGKREWDATGGHNGTGYWLPSGWEQIEASEHWLDLWREGDALLLITGHAADGFDCDPRHNGEESVATLQTEGKLPTMTGRQATPSGGWHGLIAPLGVSSDNGAEARPGVDLKSGQPDGTGRGFLFIAPTVRVSKTTGEPGRYRWTERPDVASLHGDRSGEPLAAEIRARRGGKAKSATVGAWQTDGEPSDKVQRVLDDYLAQTGKGRARHDSMRDRIMALVRHGINGEPGTKRVRAELRQAFLADLDGEPGRDPDQEFDDAERGAVAKIGAEQTAGKPNGNGRKLRVQKASEITARAVRWLWVEAAAKWIPLGGLTLLAGREGVGKSTIAYGIAAKITRGTLPGAFFGTPRSVIVCATEDAWAQTIVPRLIACGADLDRVFRVDAVAADDTPEAVQLPEDLAELERLIRAEDVALILLDPLMGSISGTLDSHKDHEVRHALEPVSRLAAEAQVSIIGLIHENKAGGADLINRIMASRAFSAVARGVLYAAKDQEIHQPKDGDKLDSPAPAHDRFLFGQPKNNLAAKVPFTLRFHIEGMTVGHDAELDEPIYGSHIVWDGTVETGLQDLVRQQDEEARNADKDNAIDRACDWLETYLLGKPDQAAPAAKIKQDGKREHDFGERLLQRARERVGAKVRSLPTVSLDSRCGN